MQKTSTQSKKLIFQVAEFPLTKIMLPKWLGVNSPILLEAWENNTRGTTHILWAVNQLKVATSKAEWRSLGFWIGNKIWIKWSGMKEWGQGWHAGHTTERTKLCGMGLGKGDIPLSLSPVLLRVMRFKFKSLIYCCLGWNKKDAARGKEHLP